MTRTNGDRGGWLREGKQPSVEHAVEKTPQFRASMERFAERAGERLSASFGGLFSASLEDTRNIRTFAALTEHEGQAAVTLVSSALDAQMAILFEVGLVDL